MEYMNYDKLFSCPTCGAISTIYLLKVTTGSWGSKIMFKLRCPTHGALSFTLPLKDKDRFIQYIKRGVFRCYQCGQEIPVDHVKAKGPWMLIKGACPTHGAKLPYQKIWGTIYNEITGLEVPTSQPIPVSTEPEPIEPALSEEFNYCPNCGASVHAGAKFCGECGGELE
ncbi:MAG: zinc ribbon domain-containing protein [Promethearchaeota archaeon]